MSVLRHCPHRYARWACCGCGESRLLEAAGGIEPPAEGSGNLVPAEQLRGAIAALKEIERMAASRADDDDMRHVAQLAAIQSVARRAANGGQ